MLLDKDYELYFRIVQVIGLKVVMVICSMGVVPEFSQRFNTPRRVVCMPLHAS